MADGREIDDTDSLRIAELFIGFVVISLLFGRLIAFLGHNTKGPTRRGLRHTIHHIEEELLALGLISLLLIVAEDYLLKICVEDDDYKKKDKNGYSSKEGSYDDKSDNHRKLLAGGGGSDCSNSEEPFWSSQTIHQTHIFIFLIAIVHVLYATASFLLCMWRMKRWERYEESADIRLARAKSTALVYGTNRCQYILWSFLAQFSPLVDESRYVAMRTLFIQRLGLSETFNFHTFLVNTMVDEFAIVVHTDWKMWLLAAAWIFVPQILLVTTVLSVVVVLVTGTKLEHVGLMLSQQAYLAYAGRHELKTQSISATNAFIKKPIEMLGARFGRNSDRLVKASNSLDALARKSLQDADRNMDLSEDFVRRYKSVGEGELTASRPVLNRGETQKQLLTEHSPSEISAATLPRPSDQSTSTARRQQEQQPAVDENRGLKKAGGFHETDTVGDVERTLSLQQNTNSVDLFWFGRPQLILNALQFVYFETAMAIALVCFDLWQSSDFIIQDSFFQDGEYFVIVSLIVVGVLCLLQTSFLMLPTYALTLVATSHCPESIIKRAEKTDLKDHDRKKLEFLRNKTLIKSNPFNRKASHNDDAHDHGEHDHEEGSNDGQEGNNSTAVLLDAMYQGQKEREGEKEEHGNKHVATEDRMNQNNQITEDPEFEEDDDSAEAKAIIHTFGSFADFFQALGSSQNAIKNLYPSAVFNFDCFIGSYAGRPSTAYDLIAIELTFSLKNVDQGTTNQNTG